MHREQLPNEYDVPGPLCLFTTAMSTRMSVTPLTKSATPVMALPAMATLVMVTSAMPPNDCALTLATARILVASVKLT